jgi:hypothetical protein
MFVGIDKMETHQFLEFPILWQLPQLLASVACGVRASAPLRCLLSLLWLLRLLRCHHPQQVDNCKLVLVPFPLCGAAGQGGL